VFGVEEQIFQITSYQW